MRKGLRYRRKGTGQIQKFGQCNQLLYMKCLAGKNIILQKVIIFKKKQQKRKAGD
jgi:hypothetical protein